MNKLDEIENLLKAVSQSKDRKERDMDFDDIEGCIMSYTDYHNEAVNQGRMLTMAKFRFDDDKFADLIGTLHEKRKGLHKDMITKTIMLNRLCDKYDVQKIYQGPLDEMKGRSDDDTRFGVAGFAEQLCYDFFKATHESTVSEHQKEAYKEHAGNILEKTASMGIMESMMEKTKARREMETSDADFTKAVESISSGDAPER